MTVRTLAAFFLLVLSLPASAQDPTARQVVTSDAPTSVSVTVYRDPNRSIEDAMELDDYLGGYALITEERTVDLPVGEVELRFNGVAGGIIPQSAIVTGLAEGVLEKNRDAALLSPSALLNGHLGRAVTIRRTSAATGEEREYSAFIRTDASNGVVLQTEEGFEAMRCTGLNEALIYPSIPEGLSAKPTLSVKTIVRQATRATVTLSYLASGFDWQANYVATISDDGSEMDLFSWVTLANGDETSFLNAQAQTVAGQPNKEEDETAPISGWSIALKCWPQGTTSDIALRGFERARADAMRYGAPMAAPMVAMEAAADQLVVVTASKITAEQEDLGDLKLYRIPVPVTVAAQSQKQVAMFEKSSVKFEHLYALEIWGTDTSENEQLSSVLRFENKKKDGLGLPLPAGQMVVFRENDESAVLLVGEGSLGDKAVGEDFDVLIGESSVILYSLVDRTEDRTDRRKYRDMELTVTNASSLPVTTEFYIDRDDDQQLRNASQRLGTKYGLPMWRTTVPANGSRQLRYRIVNRDR